jgi:hypothetical protein
LSSPSSITIFTELNHEDALGYALACLAAAAPVAAVAVSRLRGEHWLRQSATGLLAVLIVAGPILAFIERSPDNMVPTQPLGAWIFGSALLLGPLATLADWIVDRRTPREEPTAT